MALRVSSGCRNKRLGVGRASIVGHIAANTIAFTAAPDEITDSGNGLLSAGFLVGDEILGQKFDRVSRCKARPKDLHRSTLRFGLRLP